MTVCTNDASYKIVTTGATSGAGTAYPSGAHEFTSRLLWGSCYLIFSCMCMLCRSLIVLPYFFFDNCVVCSSIYGDSDYHLGIFNLQTLLI